MLPEDIKNESCAILRSKVPWGMRSSWPIEMYSLENMHKRNQSAPNFTILHTILHRQFVILCPTLQIMWTSRTLKAGLDYLGSCTCKLGHRISYKIIFAPVQSDQFSQGILRAAKDPLIELIKLVLWPSQPIRVMSSQLVYLTILFLGMLSSLGG